MSFLFATPRGRAVAIGLLSFALVAACGGAASQDAFNGAGGGDGGSASGNDGSSSTGDDGSATTGDGGGTGKDSGGGTQDGGTKDGGFKKDAGGFDAGADVVETPTIHCEGTNPCTVGTEVCCRSPGPTFACTAESGCTSIGDVPIPCDEANDCTALGHPGDVCCGTIGLGGKVNKVECASTGNCSGNSKSILCNPQDADPCPNGGTCSVSSFGGYYMCQ